MSGQKVMIEEVEEIRPPNPLKDKVGDGGIGKSVIESAEEAMRHSANNFVPVIDRYIQKISDSLNNKKNTSSDTIREVSHAVTQLKAQGSMFNYPLVTEVSELILKFLPRVKNIDGDILEIISAYQVTVRAIAKQELRGNKTVAGATLVVALKEACDRYYKYHFHKNKK